MVNGNEGPSTVTVIHVVGSFQGRVEGDEFVLYLETIVEQIYFAFKKLTNGCS